MDCDNLPSTKFTGLCSNKWKNLKPVLRPTQSAIGYAWASTKLEDFDSENNAQAGIDDNIIPAIIGPEMFVYAVDHHHELCALDYSGFEDVKVTVNIIADYRTMKVDDFWDRLLKEKYVYTLMRPSGEPNTLPTEGKFGDLPSNFSWDSFVDDPFRSIASFVRKVDNSTCKDEFDLSDTCMRCYIRNCDSTGNGIPFFEFRWGYFFNDAYINEKYWPSSALYKAFTKSYEKIGNQMEKIDVKVDRDSWDDVADSLISLCRYDDTVSQYDLDDSLFVGGGKLPGAMVGWEPIEEDDPTCGLDK